MNTATLETPPATSTPELIKHEWTKEGFCLRPEQVVIDFGAKAEKREAIVALAIAPDDTWRTGHLAYAKNGTFVDIVLALSGTAYPTRADALRAGLIELGKFFNKAKDKKGAATIEGFFESHFGANVASTEPAGEPSIDLPPLPKGRFADLRVAIIHPSPENARKVFDAIAEQELADSIRVHGQLQPIAVRRLTPEEMGEFGAISAMSKAELYEIILGERRWRAHRRLERETIECKVFEGVTRNQAKAAALVENLQRVDLNPIEEAEGYRDLMEAENLTQEQCAKRVNRSRPVVANALRVLALPASIPELIREGKLTIAHGVALARFKAWPKVVERMAALAAENKAPASTLEKGVPFGHDLSSMGAIAAVNSWRDFGNGDIPAAIKKSAAFVKDGDYSTFFLEPVIYQQAVAEHKQRLKAEQDAERDKAQKKAEAAAKNPKKIKSLEDLPRNAFAEVSKSSQPLLSLVPEDSVLDVKGYEDENVTICTKPDLFRKIELAVAELKKADRQATLPGFVEKARQRIAKTKKIGPREITLLILFAQADESHPAMFTQRAAKRQGIKLPARFHDGARLELDAADIKTLSAQDPVELWRVLADNYLQSSLSDDWYDEADELPDYDLAADGQACVLIKYLLEIDDLGLMEETKAGQKSMVEIVKTSAWYVKAIEEIDAEVVKAAGKGKGGK